MVTFSFLFPEVVLRTRSPYNHDICVVRQWSGYKLLVNGSPQSGPYIRMLWNRALRKFKLDSFQNVSKVLVLGVGGGTVIELLTQRFLYAVITAVDIDPTMIEIAKKYFGIDKHTNARLVRADANAFVKHSAKKGTVFDLIVVDLFIGPKIPEFVSSPLFLTNLHAIIKSDGHCCINYLRERQYQEKSDELRVRLSAVWKDVWDMKLYNNRFFFVGTRFADAPARRA